MGFVFGYQNLTTRRERRESGTSQNFPKSKFTVMPWKKQRE